MAALASRCQRMLLPHWTQGRVAAAAGSAYTPTDSSVACTAGGHPSPACTLATAAAALSTAAAAAAVPQQQVLPVQRLQAAISPAVCEQLYQQGYAVVDGVFGQEWATLLRHEVAALRTQNKLHKNATHLVRGGRTALLEKQHIWEAELSQADTQALAPLCAQLQRDSTLRVMLSLLTPRGALRLEGQAIKLQYNAGQGGCFPMHCDSDRSVDGRRVTAIWYLNPGWRPEHGGQLRLYPFPQAPLDIAPLHDRLVLFSSRRMPHRVLPSSAERYCFTIWLSESARPGPGGGGGSGALAGREELRQLLSASGPLDLAAALRAASHPDLFLPVVKAWYKEEWAASLEQSHAGSQERAQLLSAFWEEVAVIERAAAPVLAGLRAAAGGGLEPSPATAATPPPWL